MSLANVQKTIDQIVMFIENDLSKEICFDFHEDLVISVVSFLSKTLEEKLASYFYSRKINNKTSDLQTNLQSLEELLNYVNIYNSKCNKIRLKIESKQQNLNRIVDYRKRKLKLNQIRLKKYHSRKINDLEYENNLIRNIAMLRDNIYICQQKSNNLDKKYSLLDYKSRILNVYIVFIKNLIFILNEYQYSLNIINDSYKNMKNINRLSSDLSSKFLDFKKLYDLFTNIINQPIQNEININAMKWFQTVLTN